MGTIQLELRTELEDIISGKATDPKTLHATFAKSLLALFQK